MFFLRFLLAFHVSEPQFLVVTGTRPRQLRVHRNRADDRVARLAVAAEGLRSYDF